MLSPFASLRVNSAKHLAAHRERSFASLRMTSDPRLLPILVGKTHYRPSVGFQYPHYFVKSHYRPSVPVPLSDVRVTLSLDHWHRELLRFVQKRGRDNMQHLAVLRAL